MNWPETILLASLKAKFGKDAKIAIHDPLCCGIYWYSTCLDCLTLWDGHERQRKIPRELQAAMGFKGVMEKKPTQGKKPFKKKTAK